MLSFRKAADDPNAEHLAAHALSWIIEAGNPYYDVLFGGANPTLAFVQKWLRRASSEVSFLRVEFLMADSEFAGGYIALSGNDLRKARRADSVALLTSFAPQDRPALASRLNNLSDLMASVEDDEYYLSKVGLTQPFRGKGLGRTLVDRYISEGARLGYSRYRLDVCADNQAAIRCYRSAGFEITQTGQSQDGVLKYHSMVYESESSERPSHERART
jgi:ribosomal protein S18 acetylase RimI-like enzyme